MNWLSGLFRQWAVASVCWLAYLGYDVQSVSYLIEINWWKVMAWAVVPPAIALAMGMIVLWVGQGFRKSNLDTTLKCASLPVCRERGTLQSMAYRIEYFMEGTLRDSAPSAESLERTKQVARSEMIRHQADFARII